MSASRREIVSYVNALLSVDKIKDSSCNGLQVQGDATVNKIALSVDACMAVYKKAAQKKCQMVIVHHGMIWNGLKSITGQTYDQIRFLIENDINLYAAHLPLDMHPEVGNNAGLANMIGLTSVKPFGLYKDNFIGCEGVLKVPCTLSGLGILYEKKLGTTFSALPFGTKKIRSVAIVSGGGSDVIPEAIDKSIDCFITGEPAHHNHHSALEGKLNVLYLGHYHSETLGVCTLGKKLEQLFDVETVFIDEPTLV
jgi:dinuclear metal center YbgI/SA1388 family protein